jgi:hypothetical protein
MGGAVKGCARSNDRQSAAGARAHVSAAEQEVERDEQVLFLSHERRGFKRRILSHLRTYSQ